MCWRRWVMSMMVCALLVSITGVSPARAVDRDEVNRLYQQMVDLLKSSPNPSPKAFAEIIQTNPAAAEECLKQAKAKAGQAGPTGVALRKFSDRLEEALYLVSGAGACNEAVARRLLDRLEHSRWSREENYFVLEKLATCCPKVAKVFHLLGDQYFEERRFGLAAEAHRKGLALEDNADSRKLLAQALESMSQYQKQNPITPADVHNLLHRSNPMLPAGIGRKVEVEDRIQRQILFDEWSHRVKDQFASELKMLGDTLRKDFAGTQEVGILIEGHTDRRGPIDRNMKLSWDRAESVKRFLLEHSSIDPSRIRTEGLGPTKPYDPRDNDAGWALNRRVEFKKIDLSTQ